MNSCAEAVRTLSEAFRDDPDYAYSWHSNIAMAMLDSLNPDDIDYNKAYKACNEAARKFMKLAFDVEGYSDMLK